MHGHPIRYHHIDICVQILESNNLTKLDKDHKM